MLKFMKRFLFSIGVIVLLAMAVYLRLVYVSSPIFGCWPRSDLSIESRFWLKQEEACVTSTCFDTKSCGSRANPIFYCSKISRGSSERDLYFWLGNPDLSRSEERLYHRSKGGGINEDDVIRAIIDHGVVTQFECPSKGLRIDWTTGEPLSESQPATK